MSKWCISDVHGCYLTMLALIEKVKEKDSEAEFIFTGDFVDRGPKSKEVLEYILPRIESGEFKAVKGNHEEIMHNGIYHPFSSNWDSNGGAATRQSYSGDIDLMEEHVNAIADLPLYLIFDDCLDNKGRKLLVSHAFCADFIDEYLPFTVGNKDEREKFRDDYDEKYGLRARIAITKKGDLFNWNRNLPEKDDTGYFNITGHNITGHLLDRYISIEGYDDETQVIIDNDIGYACIDTGAFIDKRYEVEFGGKMTAISFPELEILQQKNIEKQENIMPEETEIEVFIRTETLKLKEKIQEIYIYKDCIKEEYEFMYNDELKFPVNLQKTFYKKNGKIKQFFDIIEDIKAIYSEKENLIRITYFLNKKV